MKKQYSVYKVSANLPMLRDKIVPGCTIDSGAAPSEIKVFDNREEAIAELEKHKTIVYPRFECRKAYYEVNEWRMDETIIDDSGNMTKSCDVAEMDLSELDDADDYMP